MSKSVLYMSMSLDGFITGPGDDAEHGLGIDGERLHDWLGEPDGERPWFQPPGASGQVFDEVMATGAVVVGRRTFDHAGHWDGDHHGVPIFVPTRGTPPAPQSDWVHYVTDGVERAMRQAKEAAGDANVLVHGADLAQSCLRAGVLDELEIHLVPVLLGEGRRLFDHLGAEHIELEPTRVLDAPGVTHLRYRVAT
jgi:dihydrofolate reductase